VQRDEQHVQSVPLAACWQASWLAGRVLFRSGLAAGVLLCRQIWTLAHTGTYIRYIPARLKLMSHSRQLSL
jgi:hypothetical protein